MSLVRELNLDGGLDENLYKHLQYFEEICGTLMISGLNHETLKWKAFPFLLMGWKSSGISSMSAVVMAVGLS
jgi:hypothetical protein